MKVTVFPCGAAVNESETIAVEHPKQQLQSATGPGLAHFAESSQQNVPVPLGSAGDDQWILLTNFAFSVTHQFQSDEIDSVARQEVGSVKGEV